TPIYTLSLHDALPICRSGFQPDSDTTWRLAMKPLIWKEFRENLKWVGLPVLLTLLPMLLLGGPGEPMFKTGGAMMLWFIAAAFGAALGFLQIFFESLGAPPSP